MRNKLFLFLSYLILLSGTAVSASINNQTNMDELQQIQSRLQIPNYFRCDFNQTRQISALTHPLESKGIIVLDKQKGVIWQQTTPFKQTIVMTDKRIYQDVQGNIKVILAEEQPQLFHFTTLMSDIFQGHWQTLQPFFEIKQTVNPQLWHLDLSPKNEPFNQIFQKINLSGNENVQHIELNDKQNDTTRLQFFNCTELKQLSHEQQTLLAD